MWSVCPLRTGGGGWQFPDARRPPCQGPWTTLARWRGDSDLAHPPSPRPSLEIAVPLPGKGGSSERQGEPAGSACKDMVEPSGGPGTPGRR